MSMALSLQALLADEYPYHRIEPGSSGFWSRYEIVAYETWWLSEDRAICEQRVTLDVEGRRLTVLAKI
jgi:hypothetical protein